MKKKFKEIYNLALKSRIFQLEINELIKKKQFKIPIHLALGHEFVSSLVKTNFNNKDKLLLSHRNIHFSSIFSKNVRNFKFKPNLICPKLLFLMQTSSMVI